MAKNSMIPKSNPFPSMNVATQNRFCAARVAMASVEPAVFLVKFSLFDNIYILYTHKKKENL